MACDATSGVDVQVWVSTDSPEKLGARPDGTPDFPEPLGTARLAITAEPADGERFPEVEVVLDPPVLVEEPGTVWVAAVNHFVPSDRTVYSTEFDPMPCLGGCEQGGDTVYQWVDEYDGVEGWQTQEVLPLLYVRVRHD